MTSLVGRGKYLLQEEIGQGTYGITYKAINQTNNEAVVIKTLKPELAKKEETSRFRKKFLNEAQRLLECSHPHIIHYREFFIEDEVPYIVMDYVEGKTLDKIVLPDNPLSEATAIEYILQVGEALKVIHSNGLIHRNIKPENLILHQDTQQIILIDFGIAKELEPGKVQANTSLASDGYAPIEQCLAHARLTPATDVYALAATLYTLVTAEIPIAATLRESFSLPSPQNMQPQLSNQISEVIMLGMNLESEDRPSNVEEWLALLPQEPKNSNLFTAFRSRSRITQSTINANVPRSKQNTSVPTKEHTSDTKSSNESSNNNQIFKWLAIGLLLLFGLDYIYLKFQYRKHFHNSPPQLNRIDRR